MPHFILKATRDEDCYVVWSTVVDGPISAPFTRAGAANELEAMGLDWRDLPAAMDRADATGTSMQASGHGAWDDAGLICNWRQDEEVRPFWLPRDDISAYLRGEYVGETLEGV